MNLMNGSSSSFTDFFRTGTELSSIERGTFTTLCISQAILVSVPEHASGVSLFPTWKPRIRSVRDVCQHVKKSASQRPNCETRAADRGGELYYALAQVKMKGVVIRGRLSDSNGGRTEHRRVPEVAVVLRQRTASFLLPGGPELRNVPFSHVIEASSLARTPWKFNYSTPICKIYLFSDLV